MCRHSTTYMYIDILTSLINFCMHIDLKITFLLSNFFANRSYSHSNIFLRCQILQSIQYSVREQRLLDGHLHIYVMWVRLFALLCIDRERASYTLLCNKTSKSRSFSPHVMKSCLLPCCSYVSIWQCGPHVTLWTADYRTNLLWTYITHRENYKCTFMCQKNNTKSDP